ncbi:MAG: MarR family transcriptional regulator [Candidatus Moranbacteria bacterium]|nr:MarR family transcriptional regulator [Candidatus Moranbacteria bacterium]
MSKKEVGKTQKERSYSKVYQVEFLQWQASRAMEQMLENILMPYQVSVSEWRLLGMILKQGELQATEIAMMMGVRLPLVTRNIGNLRRKKWITILPHTKDRRIKRIFISPVGREKLQEIERGVSKSLQKSFRGVTKEEMSIYSEVLTKIIFNGSF